MLEDRVAVDETRLGLVEGRVELVRHDLGVASARVNYLSARHAEDSDAVANERCFLVFFLCVFFSD